MNRKIKLNLSKNNIILILVFIFTFLSLLFIKAQFIDKKVNIYYRVYSNKGWSRWVKNDTGVITSGNIKNIQFKIKSSTKGDITYNYFADGWSKNYYASQKQKNVEKIYGVKYSLFDDLNNNYQICYKTYNKKNKWLEWSCENELNGNKNVPVSGVKFKIIPKGVLKNEWLEDYDKSNKIKSKVNF